MLPVAVQERQGEDPDQPSCSVGRYAEAPQLDPERPVDRLHYPHYCYNEQGDDEATQKLFSFCFVVHAYGFIKNRSAAKVGNFGRVA